MASARARRKAPAGTRGRRSPSSISAPTRSVSSSSTGSPARRCCCSTRRCSAASAAASTRRGRLQRGGRRIGPGQSRPLRAPGQGDGCRASRPAGDRGGARCRRTARNSPPPFEAALRRARCACSPGAEEAKLLGARRASPASPEADGMMGDLGGGSLELVGLDRGELGPHVTLPLGPLRVGDAAFGERDQARDLIDGHLESVPWLARPARAEFLSRWAAPGARWRASTWTRPAIRCTSSSTTASTAARPRICCASWPRLGPALAGGDFRPAAPARRHAALRGLAAGAPAAPRAAGCDHLLGVRPARGLSLPASCRAAQRRQDPLLAAARDWSTGTGASERWAICSSDWTAPLFADETAERAAPAPGRLPAERHRLARPSRLSRRAGFRPHPAPADRRHRP